MIVVDRANKMVYLGENEVVQTGQAESRLELSGEINVCDSPRFDFFCFFGSGAELTSVRSE